eukprot:scaffold162858_cov13-Tisochrysis_lutea.AAC.1
MAHTLAQLPPYARIRAGAGQREKAEAQAETEMQDMYAALKALLCVESCLTAASAKKRCHL